MTDRGNLQPVSSPPLKWKLGKNGKQYPVYEDEEEYPVYDDDELSDDDDLDDYPFHPPDIDDDHLLDYYEIPPKLSTDHGGVHKADSKIHVDPFEDHKKRMNGFYAEKVKISKAEADKIISKSIAKTLRNFKDSNGKKGKGIYFYCLKMVSSGSGCGLPYPLPMPFISFLFCSSYHREWRRKQYI